MGLLIGEKIFFSRCATDLIGELVSSKGIYSKYIVHLVCTAKLPARAAAPSCPCHLNNK